MLILMVKRIGNQFVFDFWNSSNLLFEAAHYLHLGFWWLLYFCFKWTRFAFFLDFSIFPNVFLVERVLLDLMTYLAVLNGYFRHQIVLSDLLELANCQNLPCLYIVLLLLVLIILQEGLMSQLVKLFVHFISFHVIDFNPCFLHFKIKQLLFDLLDILLPRLKHIIEAARVIFMKLLHPYFEKRDVHALNKFFFILYILLIAPIFIYFFWKFLKDFLSIFVFVYSRNMLFLPDFFLCLLGKFFLNLIFNCVGLMVLSSLHVFLFQFGRGVH